MSSLRLQPTFRPNLPASLRLASPANVPAPLSSRPATVAACRTSSHAFQSPSSLRLPSIFRLNLPANLFDSRLLVDLPALLPNLTSDSRRRRICWRCPQIDRRPSPLINLPALPADQPPTLIVCCIPSALLSGSSSTRVSDSPSGAACGASSASPAAESLRRCPPANRRLASPTNLPALPDEPNLRLPGRCVLRLCFPSDRRLASPINLPVSPSDLLFGLRLGSIFRLPSRHSLGLRLVSDRPASPSNFNLRRTAPTGMHSQNIARSVAETLSSCSPLPLLSGLGSVLQNPSAFSTC